MFANEIMKLRK